MRMEEIVAAKKAAFLATYNTGWSAEVAARRAIGAASQHNKLYCPDRTPNEREDLKAFWCKALREDALQKYANKVEGEAHHSIITDLAKKLNEFGRKKGLLCDEGAKISHAQKSLNVYMKHLWCMDRIEEPPECPVDRRILTAAGWPWNGLPWTRVTTIEQHQNHIDWLRKVAHNPKQGLAEWELLNFNPQGG